METKRHRYLVPDTETKDLFIEGSWFVEKGLPLINAMRYSHDSDDFPNLATHRLLLAQEIQLASSKAHFYDEYDDFEKGLRPTERDRESMLAYLSLLASLTGLLHVNEIEKLVDGPYGLFTEFIPVEKDELLSYEEMREVIREWKREGNAVVGFQGSFDPPTETHLANITDAVMLAEENGVVAKIVVIIDGDELIQERKGSKNDVRPRFSIDKRREVLESFWQVAGTCVSSVKFDGDFDGHIEEYGNLGLDYVLLDMKSDPGYVDRGYYNSRLFTIRQAGLKVFWARGIPDGISSTDLMRGLGWSEGR